MDVHIIPILEDNYTYVVISNDQVGVIDPGEAQPIIDFLNTHNLSPTWVINTHKHWDHVNGNAYLLSKYPLATLAAPEECGASDHPFIDGEIFKFGAVDFEITLTKGHTNGHIILFDPVNNNLFSGDTLFAMGCGRLFEGSHADMFQAMTYIKSLPSQTKIYCGHEYTKTNAKFALELLPENSDIQNRYDEIKDMKCTMPTTLAIELKTNPFLMAETVEFFTKYRQKRDNF